MEKVKEVIHKVTHPKDDVHSGTTTGTHSGVTGHNAGTHTTGTHTGAHTTGTHTTGTHHNHNHNAGTTGTHTSGTAGPHDSNLANRVDPTVDSDMDGSRNMGAARHGPGATANSGLTGSHQTGATGYNNGNSGLTGSTGTTHGTTSTSTNAGPHNSNLANKLDPRVDSDLDGSRTAPGGGTGAGYGNSGLTGTHQTTGAGLTNSHQTTGTTGYGSTSTNAGPHDSNLANKLDPRIDSDLDGSRTAPGGGTGTGYGNSGLTGTHQTTGAGLTNSHQTTGTTGYGSTSTNAGPHDSNLANKLDPRIDSDLDGSRTAPGGGTGAGYGNSGNGLTGTHNNGAGVGTSGYGNGGLTGTSHTSAHTGQGLTGQQHGGLTGHHLDGPAPNTAGPHKSDMLNRVDPRIDSDRDGSKTIGGNPQY